MTRKVSLRKCPTHPDCQLQRVNNGDWEHTPSSRPLRERFLSHDDLTRQLEQELGRVEDLRRLLGDIGRESNDALARAQAGIPDVKALKREVSEELVRAGELNRILTELGGRMGTVLAEFQVETTNLPKTLDLQAKANRARERLDSDVKIAQKGLERLERAFQAYDSEASQRANRISALGRAEEDIRELGRKAEEAHRSALSKLAQADSLLTALLESKSALERVDSLHSAVRQLSDEVKAEVKAIRSSDKETRRLIEHEREERLAATAKSVRSLRNHIEVSHA